MHYFIHYVSVQGPGGSHDSGIFKKTDLYGWLERRLYEPFRNAILIADSAYEVSIRLAFVVAAKDSITAWIGLRFNSCFFGFISKF